MKRRRTNKSVHKAERLGREPDGECDEDYRASLAAIESGISDVIAGRTVPMRQFFRDFDRRHQIESPSDDIEADRL